MKGEQRKQVLIAATLVLLAAVGADRLGLFDGGRGAGGGGGAPATLEAKAALLADQKALVARRSEWERAKEEADAALAAVGERVIRGKTVQIAEDELKKLADREIRSLGLTIAGSDSATPTASRADGVRRVGVVLSLETDDPEKVTRVVDLLENMSDVVTSVERVKIVGPGSMPTHGSVEATITLMGLAWIEERVEGAGGEA